MENIWSSIVEFITDGSVRFDGFFTYYTFVVRFVLPVLALIVLVRCVRSLFNEEYEPEEWGRLTLPNGSYVTLYHWENTIGRAKY